MRMMQIHMLQRRNMSVICKNAVFINIRAQAIRMYVVIVGYKEVI